MIGKDRVEALAAQLFRRIGYTNGLAHLLRFSEVCDLIGTQPAVAKDLLSRVGKHFEVDTPDAKGKLDVLGSFGLTRLVAGRYSLTALGRAARAIAATHGVDSPEARAFYFRRVVQADADYSLTLLLVLKRIGPAFTSSDYPEFASTLDKLLVAKHERILAGSVPLSLRRLAEDRIRVQWRAPARSPIERLRLEQEKRRMKSALRYVEMQGPVLVTWVRHTVDPRKGWLLDLRLTRKSDKGHELTDSGSRLVDHLRSVAEADSGFAVIDVEPEVLRDYAMIDHLFTSTAVDQAYWDAMTSVAISGRTPELIRLEESKFLEMLTSAYARVRLEQFPQAETAGLREVVVSPLLARGQRIDFEQQLKNLVKAEPGRVTRIPSPRDEAAYVSIRSV